MCHAQPALTAASTPSKLSVCGEYNGRGVVVGVSPSLPQSPTGGGGGGKAGTAATLSETLAFYTTSGDGSRGEGGGTWVVEVYGRSTHLPTEAEKRGPFCYEIVHLSEESHSDTLFLGFVDAFVAIPS